MYQAINEYIIAKESSKETASGIIITAKDITTFDVIGTTDETKQLLGKKVEVAHRHHRRLPRSSGQYLMRFVRFSEWELWLVWLGLVAVRASIRSKFFPFLSLPWCLLTNNLQNNSTRWEGVGVGNCA